ncbi:bifunctional phosphoribosylaminoimidazolecarboxamide formyltransferase/inosine monophosphate cyclohydrolase, partial [candidate division KSB1 bacterium]
ALISVSDKKGVVEFARALSEMGVKIISTGGTAKVLSDAGVSVVSVESITGFGEMMDGRVKTLHPKIFGGILADKDNELHIRDLNKNKIETIDMVVVNLYPFKEEVVEKRSPLKEAINFIDIGGAALIRASAKNYRFCVPVVNPESYNIIIERLKNNNNVITEDESFKFAISAFKYTYKYDRMIYEYFISKDVENSGMPSYMEFYLKKYKELRYGENAHQKAGLYIEDDFIKRTEAFKKLHGKELSYNNLVDIDTAFEAVNIFEEPATVILKHTNPCGVGIGENLKDSYRKALDCDPVSAFGGIVGFNRKVDRTVAEQLYKIFLEVIVAPEFDDSALEILKKKKNLRLINTDNKTLLEKKYKYDIKLIGMGFLIQEKDYTEKDFSRFEVVSKREPTEDELKALYFGWKVIRFIKSNAVVFCRADRTLGIGAGQMSRVDSVELATMKAKNAGISLRNSVLASDAFFPFRDGIDKAYNAGATAIIQPGGSIRDKEVIEAVDEHNMAMIFTGVRHFRH